MTNTQDTRITYRAILDRAANDAREWLDEVAPWPKMPERQCYADSARGIYIPQHFAESIKRERVSGIDLSDLDTLALGPDACESYWDIWADVLDSCVLTDESGQEWTLYQDGDLFLVPANAYQAWEEYIDALESADPYELASETQWDWTIFYHRALELCQAVPSDVLSDAEGDWFEITDGVRHDESNFGFYELASQLAYIIVEREIVDAVEQVRDELLELANNQLENL